MAQILQENVFTAQKSLAEYTGQVDHCSIIQSINDFYNVGECYTMNVMYIWGIHWTCYVENKNTVEVAVLMAAIDNTHACLPNIDFKLGMYSLLGTACFISCGTYYFCVLGE